ncbi:ParA family protein [Tersicoccus sp. MR15.9]|uniref:ParA family protein n=1 Tax=Tersicoccus mangrovi TaxID=3121635 RepID=UPI002FE690DC
MRVVSVVNQKGGTGKTTMAVNLAAIFSQHARVLLVDVDPQKSATFWATVAEEAGDGGGLSFDVVSETDPDVLKDMRKVDEYDTIVVDTPGNLVEVDVLKSVANASDFVVMPTEPAPLSMPPLINTYRTVVEPAGVDYRVVITKVDSRSLTDAADTQELLRGSGLLVCKSYVRSYKVHERAPLAGQAATTYESTRHAIKAAGDFKDVANELLSIWANGTRS